MLLEQCDAINALPLHSIQVHQLQLVKGTRIVSEFEQDPSAFLSLDLDDYLDLIVDILERLRPDLFIERVAGEVPPRFVDVPQWGLIRNVEILNRLNERLESRDAWQGRLYK